MNFEGWCICYLNIDCSAQLIKCDKRLLFQPEAQISFLHLRHTYCPTVYICRLHISKPVFKKVKHSHSDSKSWLEIMIIWDMEQQSTIFLFYIFGKFQQPEVKLPKVGNFTFCTDAKKIFFLKIYAKKWLIHKVSPVLYWFRH